MFCLLLLCLWKYISIFCASLQNITHLSSGFKISISESSVISSFSATFYFLLGFPMWKKRFSDKLLLHLLLYDDVKSLQIFVWLVDIQYSKVLYLSVSVWSWSHSSSPVRSWSVRWRCRHSVCLATVTQCWQETGSGQSSQICKTTFY